jgi:hypothetical protein
VLLLGSIVVIGLLLGWGFGGRIRNLAELEVRLWWLVPIALVMQVISIPRTGEGPGRYAPFAVLLLSFVLIGVVMAANWSLRGFPTILLGVILNVIPIAINQGMPVSGAAVVESGGSLEAVPRELGEKHHLLRPEDRLTALADVIAVRPPFQAVVSAGDLVMWVGAGWFLTAAMLGRPRRERRPSPAPRRTARSSRT